jgi:hypothetical protein
MTAISLRRWSSDMPAGSSRSDIVHAPSVDRVLPPVVRLVDWVAAKRFVPTG